ncbi:MAG: hypothetical protein AB7P69_22475 [Candidatus Binatia bacterium]
MHLFASVARSKALWGKFSAVASIDDLQRLMTEEQVGFRSTLMLIRQAEKIELTIMPEESRSVKK